VKSTSKPPRTEAAEPPDTRQRVLLVARDMITKRGNAEISLVDLAAQAGLSRQTLYLLFGSRAGLLLAMVDHIDQTSAGPRQLATVRQGLAPGDAFEPYLRAWFDYLPVVFPIARALSAAATAGDEDARVAWKSRMDKLRGGFVQMTKGLRSAGLLADGWTPEAAADWVYAMTHVDTWQHLVVDSHWKPNTAVDRIVATLRQALIKRA